MMPRLACHTLCLLPGVGQIDVHIDSQTQVFKYALHAGHVFIELLDDGVCSASRHETLRKGVYVSIGVCDPLWVLGQLFLDVVPALHWEKKFQMFSLNKSK
jgi:hypothetical protein